jgi:SAM-dependent methyltransferase
VSLIADQPATSRLRLGGPIALGEREVFARFRQKFDISGKRILEVGGCLPGDWTQTARVWWSIDPLNRDCMSWRHRRVLTGHADALPDEIGQVDAVFSCNSFQHVSNLGRAYREIARLLIPGGIAYLNFGPIWSAPDGSHIENILVDGRSFDFWNGALLPSWSHLVLGFDELLDLAVELHGDAIGRAIVDYTMFSRWINRIALHEHLSLPSEAGLEVLSARGTTRFGYRYNPPKAPARFVQLASPAVVAACHARFQLTPRDMRVRDLELLLRRPLPTT